ncbi:hypothetical protein Tco_1282650 [Tanacetum coccineum]
MAQLKCSHCGGLFNGGNCPSCSIVGARNEFVHDPYPFPYDNTPDFYDQPPQHNVETYSCELCGNNSHYGFDYPPRVPLVYEQEPCYNQNFSDNYYPQNSPSFSQQYLCCENCGGPHESFQCQPMNQNHFEHNSNYSGFDQPPQHSIDHQEDLNQQRISDVHNRWDKLEESQNELLNMVRSFCEMVIQRKQVANISTYTPEPSRRYNYEDDDDDEEYSIPLNKMPQILWSIALTPVSSIMEPKDSLIMGDEHLSTIPEKESDEVIKSSVEDLVPIPSESEDTFEGDSEYDLPSCDDFSSINVPCDNSVTLSNPLFDSNDDFTSSDDESLSDEDVPEDNVKIYSNPLFEFDDEYISSDVNPLFDEVLEDIESEDSYVSKLDDLDLLVTPLFAFNKDECFNPGGDIDELDAFLDIVVSPDFEDDYYDSKGEIIYLESLLIKETIPNLPPEVFFDRDPKSLKDEPDNDYFKSMVKVFDPRIHKKNFSLTYVRLSFEDRHYLSLAYVIRIFLPYFTYPVESPFLLSSGSEDTIFDPGIFAFHFSSLKPVASHQSGTFICFNVYLNILNESLMEVKLETRTKTSASWVATHAYP